MIKFTYTLMHRCRYCCTQYIYKYPENCCKDCLHNNLIPKPTWSYTFKRFTYFSLIMLPPLFYIQCNFSPVVYGIVYVGFFLGMIINNLVDWLANKF